MTPEQELKLQSRGAFMPAFFPNGNLTRTINGGIDRNYTYGFKWYRKNPRDGWHQFGIIYRVNQLVLGLDEVILQTDWLRDMIRHNKWWDFVQKYVPFEWLRGRIMQARNASLFKLPKKYRIK